MKVNIDACLTDLRSIPLIQYTTLLCASIMFIWPHILRPNDTHSKRKRKHKYASNARGNILLTTNHALPSCHRPATYPTPSCPLLPHFTQHNVQSHYCWFLSLIQYFKGANSNMYHHKNPLHPYILLHTCFNFDEDTPLTLNEILALNTRTKSTS